jgi:HlyD family secretion protein
LKKLIFISIVILFLIGLVVYAYVRPGKTASGTASAGASGRGQTSTAVGTAKVEKGNISQNILATGAIEARAEVEVYPKQTGELVDVKVEEGARVKAGQVLAVIESNVFEIQVKQALADMESAKAAFDKDSSLAFVSSESNFKQAKSSVDRLQSVLKQSELDLQLQEKQTDIQKKKADADLRIAQAKLDAAVSGAREQDLEQARVRTENAKKNLDRMNELLKAAMISQDQVESAQLQYDIYKAQLSLLEEGTRPEDIEVLKAQVEVAKTSLESAESNKDLIL